MRRTRRGRTRCASTQNAGKWVDAWVAHKPPPANAVGLMYMLEGGTDASNTDPYAPSRPAATIGSRPDRISWWWDRRRSSPGHPAGAKPDTSVPYVMWAGTPYAHLMVPVNTAPRTRASFEGRRAPSRVVGPRVLRIAAAHVLGDVAPAAARSRAGLRGLDRTAGGRGDGKDQRHLLRRRPSDAAPARTAPGRELRPSDRRAPNSRSRAGCRPGWRTRPEPAGRAVARSS